MVVTVSPAQGMAFLSSVYARAWRTAWINLNGTSMYEMLRLLDQIDRADLADFLKQADLFTYEVNLPRIVFAASVVQNRKLPSPIPDSVGGQVGDAKTFLTSRSPLRITRDPTSTLPRPSPSMPALTPQEFADAAKELGAETAAVQAVAWCEGGGGSGFAADGRPLIRYELHVFQKSTNSKYAKTHPHLSQSYKAGIGYHTRSDSQANEWSMLYGAMLLRGRREAALAAASWGAFQIMGFNHKACGYLTASAFAQDMCRSAANQLQAFLRFSKKKGAQEYLVKKDWAGFALHYNGPDYRSNNYDTNMAAAYRRYSAGT